jgi:hypothetical protein
MWLDELNKQVSLYATHADNIGKAATYRDIFYTAYKKDLPTINKLRNLDKSSQDYKKQKLTLKSQLQCYAPAALLKTKATGKLTEINRTGIMQLDFDQVDIQDYDIEELKQCIFNLPFIGFCGLSCGGDGFYALALIAEPMKLAEYAEHCFKVFASYGIKADTSKGKKVENLRYLSYDKNMLIRENPEPLLIEYLEPLKKPIGKTFHSAIHKVNLTDSPNKILNKEIIRLQNAEVGSRWQTVQRAAFTLGGLGNPNLVNEIINVINTTSAFDGEEEKYCKCARDCFDAGMQEPLLN